MSDDFWQTSDGTDLRDERNGNFDSGDGDFETIPDNTNAIAVVDAVEWKQDPHMNEYVSLRWSLEQPDTYYNRKIFQKLWVKDFDPKAKDGKAKRDKARKMFAAIDANAGGKLARAGREPNTDDMALALFKKPMGIKIKVWKMTDSQTDEKIEGNWISAVMPKAETEVTKPKARTEPAKSAKDDLDDDIPFD